MRPLAVGSLKPTDAVITFHCLPLRLVQVIERVKGANIHHPRVERNPAIVAEMEEKYIFYAKEADFARKQLMRGRSCEFNVFLREP
jgi:hypothetical protein